MEHNQLIETITDLYNKYKDNPYALQRLQIHIGNLPTLLENENEKNNQRISRFNELTVEQENFYKVFLSNNLYYYMPFKNLFYEYDNKNYKVISEDNILYKLLSTITDDGKLMDWKYKTKNTLIKKIKERQLFKSIPETYTIQHILTFLQTIFETKTESKYFLTIIGDILLKKNNDDILFMTNSTIKQFIMMIDVIGYVTSGISIRDKFITKYHENHNIENYRLIKCRHENNISLDIIKNVLNDYGLDLLVVATYYSETYSTSENYLNFQAEDEMQNYVLYFNKNSKQNIVNNFINECIKQVEPETHAFINWNNMRYIWKLYLNSLNIPDVMYSVELEKMLSLKLDKSESSNEIIFINITSKFLPYVYSFLSFWEKHITILNDDQIIQSYTDEEFEIDELLTLFKSTELKKNNITELNIINMIKHYFSPNITIIDNKYVQNIKCNLWSKQDDIYEFLAYYKLNLINNQNQTITEMISFDDIYKNYKIYFKNKRMIEKKQLLLVSKQFFEKIITSKLSNHIIFDKFVSLTWLQD